MKLPELQTERLLLRLPTIEDVPSLLDYHKRNRLHLKPFSPVFPEDFFTAEYWRVKVEGSIDEFHLGLSCRFFLFPLDNPEHVVGHCSFSQIFRGVFHACYLGYTVDRELEGGGYMREGLQEAIRYMFEEWNLHRIMANYMPHNVRSGRLLRHLGFVPEGYARDYIQIDGKWEDHVLTSLTNPKWRKDK
ncbi:MAG: ribosomal protein S5-alanine N-acetyltransferase [Candidatus Kapaibacterium sp.]